MEIEDKTKYEAFYSNLKADKRRINAKVWHPKR